MRDRLWLGVLISLALAGQSFAMVSQEIGPQPPVEGTVSFDLYQGYLIVARGSAGTRTSLTFLLDTGASPTVIDTRLARKLHLQAAPASAAVLVAPDCRHSAADVALAATIQVRPAGFPCSFNLLRRP